MGQRVLEPAGRKNQIQRYICSLELCRCSLTLGLDYHLRDYLSNHSAPHPLLSYAYVYSAFCAVCVCVVGAGEPEEDELYESGVLDSNGVYRLQGDKLVPHDEAWASIPSVSLLNSKEVTPL